MSHDRLNAVAEQAEQIVDQAALSFVAGDYGFEDVGVADFLDAAKGFFGFEAIDGGLDGGVGGTVFCGEGFLNFADGGDAVVPEGFHDLEFEAAEFG